MNEPHTASPYRVLARKYRPARFADLIGQDVMVRTLTNAFDSGRIPQALMLTGVRGVGKTTTARILARALNYEHEGVQGPSVHLNAEGVHCRAIIEGRHVDVQEMDAASHTGIDTIRELTEAARYKPMSARYKVFIIDEVHMLSTAAFNGLLKTLEEPPEHVKFIFATTEIRKVPLTILSRCQRFDLRRIDGAALANFLVSIAVREGVTLEAEAALVLARAAEGSVRDGLSMLDQAIAHAGESQAVIAAAVVAMLGLSDRARIYDTLDHVFAGRAAEALGACHALYQDGADPLVLLTDMLEAVHLMTKIKAAPLSVAAAGLPEAERSRAQALAALLSLRVLTRAWQVLLKGVQELHLAARPLEACEMVLLRLAHAADLPTPDSLIAQLQSTSPPPAAPLRANPVPSGFPVPGAPRGSGFGSNLGGAAQGAPALVPHVAPHSTPQARLQSFEDILKLADEQRELPLKIALERFVHLVGFEPGRIEFRLDAQAPASLAGDLQKRLTQWTGARWMVVLSHEAGAPTVHETKQKDQDELKARVLRHATVQAVLDHFPGARLVNARPRPADSNA